MVAFAAAGTRVLAAVVALGRDLTTTGWLAVPV